MSASLPTKKKSTTETEAFLSGKLAQVDVARIERELKELWSAAGETAEKKSESESSYLPIANVMRACTANVVLFSTDDDAEVKASEILDDIAVRHPSRAILAISRPSRVERLEAWVSARCHMADARSLKQICSEQITVRYEGEGSRELASVVAPLALSDLPVVLWWQAQELDDEKLSPFLRFADRLVADSGRAENLNVYFNKLERLLTSGKGMVTSDLSWGRILPFRRSIAIAFGEEGSPLPLAALSSLVSISICFAARQDGRGDEREGALSQALLLCAWLASRLGWKADSLKLDKKGGRAIFKGQGGKVEVDFVKTETASLSDGAILSVSLVAESPEKKAVMVRKAPDEPGLSHKECRIENMAEITVTDGRPEERDDFFHSVEAGLIDRELELGPADQILEESVKMLCSMLAKIERNK